MFTEKEIKQIQEQGLTTSEVENQIERFVNGYPKLNVVDSATISNGIIAFTDEEKQFYIDLYENERSKYKITKFVPASGAATRMFANMFEVLNTYDDSEEKYLELVTDRSANSIYYTCEHLEEFAFYNDLIASCEENGECVAEKIAKKDYVGLIELILTKKGLNYGNYPKGLIKFHKYSDGIRTAVEEHLVEGALYAESNKVVNIHFTISEEFKFDFENHFKEVVAKYEKMYGVKYNISLSFQSPKTNTIAVTVKNNPFKNQDGQFVFRPGGHGALLKNLNEIDSDIVFIKNIDNVVEDHLKNYTVEYKKLLGGLLIEIQNSIFKMQDELLSANISDEIIERVAEFVVTKLFVVIPESFNDLKLIEKIKYLQNILNRPIRVCGMVRNENEPGGGPFWVENSLGQKTLQIVESSQFDLKDKVHRKIFNMSTHFNPVDIVCSIKDKAGKLFDLNKFVDGDTGFISNKTINGKKIKALEHPGLWNGAMANWNTIFVEVPIETFNPVKTINDLLKKEHTL